MFFDKILNFRSGENFPFNIYAIGAEIAKTSDSTPIAFNRRKIRIRAETAILRWMLKY